MSTEWCDDDYVICIEPHFGRQSSQFSQFLTHFHLNQHFYGFGEKKELRHLDDEFPKSFLSRDCS